MTETHPPGPLGNFIRAFYDVRRRATRTDNLGLLRILWLLAQTAGRKKDG